MSASRPQLLLLLLLLLSLDAAGKYSYAESKILVDAVKEYVAINSVSVEVRSAVHVKVEVNVEWREVTFRRRCVATGRAVSLCILCCLVSLQNMPPLLMIRHDRPSSTASRAWHATGVTPL